MIYDLKDVDIVTEYDIDFHIWFDINNNIVTNNIPPKYPNILSLWDNKRTFLLWRTLDHTKPYYDRNINTYIYQNNSEDQLKKADSFFLVAKDVLTPYTIYYGENSFLRENCIGMVAAFNTLKKYTNDVAMVGNDILLNSKKIWGHECRNFNEGINSIHIECGGLNYYFKKNKDVFAEAYHDTKFYTKTMSAVTGVGDEFPDMDRKVFKHQLLDELNKLAEKYNIK
jgi:hypothetical protein